MHVFVIVVVVVVVLAAWVVLFCARLAPLVALAPQPICRASGGAVVCPHIHERRAECCKHIVILSNATSNVALSVHVYLRSNLRRSTLCF